MSENQYDILRQEITELKQYTLLAAKEVLNLNDVAIWTGISKAHLYRLTSEQEIPHYKKGKNLFFKKSEIEEWMLENKVLTKTEIESMAVTHIVTHRR